MIVGASVGNGEILGGGFAVAPGPQFVADSLPFAKRAETGPFDGGDGGLTPKLPELIKRTSRGVHLLAYLKHEELMQMGRVHSGTIPDHILSAPDGLA